MTADNLKKKIESWIAQSLVVVTDLTGTQDHYQIEVHSPAFKGKTRLERHRMVLDAVQAEVASGELHALSIQTFEV